MYLYFHNYFFLSFLVYLRPLPPAGVQVLALSRPHSIHFPIHPYSKYSWPATSYFIGVIIITIIIIFSSKTFEIDCLWRGKQGFPIIRNATHNSQPHTHCRSQSHNLPFFAFRHLFCFFQLLQGFVPCCPTFPSQSLWLLSLLHFYNPFSPTYPLTGVWHGSQITNGHLRWSSVYPW